MDNKKQNLRPPTDEELKEMFRGIIQENHDNARHPTFPASPIFPTFIWEIV